MLTELTVENLGIIKRAHLEFPSGMVAISGESGAGKSMLLGGLKLMLGGRADTNIIRNGADRAAVDGVWTITDKTVCEYLEERGATVENNEFSVSRVVGGEGVRSRFLVSGRPAPTSTMDSMKDVLVEIHGQSDQVKLRDPSHQRDVLDNYGKGSIAPARNLYNETYREWRFLSKKIKDFEENFSRREIEQRYNEDLVKRFEDLSPEENELELISEEIEKLSHLEEISEKLSTVAGTLFNEDREPPLEIIENALALLRRISQHDKELDTLVNEIEETLDPLSEKLNELESYISSVDLDDLGRLAQLEDRLFELKIFAKPFGGDLNKAVEAAVNARETLEHTLEDSDIDSLKERLSEIQIKLSENAEGLTKARRVAADELAKKVNEELEGLAMGGTTFIVDISQTSFGPSGVDEISFMVESKGSNKRPIVKSASGGELSRLMLALEVVAATDEHSITFIFDEIDTGVGGATAMEIGRRLAKLAEKHQVIVVTHLPQVAAWADAQLVISKDTSGDIISDVQPVAGEGRVREIARMLSGLGDSETGLAHAEELLKLTGKN